MYIGITILLLFVEMIYLMIVNASALPGVIKKRIEQLTALVTKFPMTIPVIQCAKYLNISDEGLRSAIRLKQIPGAIYWKQPGKQNYAYKIETLKFYFWQLDAVSSKKLLHEGKGEDCEVVI